MYCAGVGFSALAAAVGKSAPGLHHSAGRGRRWLAGGERKRFRRPQMVANKANQPMSFRSLLRFETLLASALLLEILIFGQTGENFATRRNMFEVLRLSTEIGLLALVMTPIILSGGIDLSIGSLLGLCAIVFGKLWRDAGLPPATAAICTLALGAAGGWLNAWFITRLKLPPLIVTLGSFSLFRGLAEAITRGVDNFTNFPKAFLFLGQGYLFD